MAFGDSAGILFKIKGDESDAIRAFKNTEVASSKLTASTAGLSSSFAALANPVALAATAIVGLATAAVGATVKLFDLAQSTAEYGSAIFDATQKTGLAAETMSALKIAAEQSGSSFESITNSVAKFNVLLGNAANGNEKAAAVLKQYGITATDTQTALEQAVAVIGNMANASQQAAAAGALFKDRTGEILPVIKSFEGNLPGLIGKLREMGVLMSDKDAKAADEFGDQMDMLNTQLSGIGRTIGFAVMPVFLKFANSLSDWLVKNQSSIQSWANAFGTALSKVSGLLLKLYDDARRAFAALQAVAILTQQGPMGLGQAITLVQGVEAQIQADNAARNSTETSAGASGRPQTDTNTQTQAQTQSAKVNTIQIDQTKSTQKQINDAAISGLQDRLRRELALWTAHQETVLARMKADVQIRAVTEEEFFKKKREFEDETLAKTLANLQAERDKRKELGLSTLEIDNQIAIKNSEIEKVMEERREKDAQDANRRREDEKKELEFLEKKRASWAEHIQQLERRKELEDAEQERKALAAIRAQSEANDPAGDGTLLGGLAGAAGSLPIPSIFGGNDQMLDDAAFVKEVWGGVFDSIGQGLGQMTQGLAAMGAAWLATGKFSAKAALQMASSIALSLAMQAGVAAIMEVARGYAEAAASAASYAVGDVAGGTAHALASGLHFSAAAVYGTVAGVAAGVGVGLGLAARAAGGGDKSGQAFKSQTSTSSSRTHNTSGQGEAYSSQKDGIMEAGRNAPISIGVTINDDSQFLGKMLKFHIKNNNEVRDMIRTVAAT